MDIYKLVEKREKRQNYKDELFRKILEQCHRRIEHSSDSGDLYSIFTIPNYVIGYPIFNKSECIDYLIQQLDTNGFKVQAYGDGYLYISWAHVYDKYIEDKVLSNNLLEFEPKGEIVRAAEDKKETKMRKINSLILNQNNKFSILE
jgi:hypothetical protein